MNFNNYFQYISFVITLLSVLGVFLGIKSSLGKDIDKLDAKFENKFTILDHRIDKLDAKFENKFTILDRRIDKLDDRLRDVERDVSSIKARLSIISGSPLKLAEGGKRILKDIGGKKIIDNNFKILSTKINKLKPENKYQTLDYAQKIIGDDFYNLIQKDKQDILFKQGYTKNATINALAMLILEKI
jgi:hypothetical protein